MRIAIVTETFLPSTDGIVTRLCASIKWLRNHGHEVIVIAPDLGIEDFYGAKIFGIPARPFFLYKSKNLSLPSRKVKQCLITFQPDIVHVVNPALLGAAGIYYSKRLKLPLVASYHTNIPQYLDYYRIPYLKPILWKYLNILHNRADLNLCTSQTVKIELDQRKFHNVKVWNRGVDLERFNPKHFDHNMRMHLTNGSPERKLLLFVGRLAAEKNIESIRSVLESSPDYCLALVGDGPFRSTLENHFKDTNTVFCGFMHGEELSKAYASSDVFVFPSITETLGLVLMEAMAAGLPVVAAKSGPTCEQIEHGETGVLYNPDQPNGLLNAVLSLNNMAFSSKISIQTGSYVKSFSWTGPSEQIYQLYREVIEHKKGLR
ncbi:MAG: glycosyl transferase [Bacilli bacterium]|nr:glycosyl transferase [Bacilli bacterium]